MDLSFLQRNRFSTLLPVNTTPISFQTRNSWAHAVISEWYEARFQAAFTNMESLAVFLPNSAALLEELEDDKVGCRKTKFHQKKFLLAVNSLRSAIGNGQLDKIQNKIKRLADKDGREIYMKRTFKNIRTEAETQNIEGMILNNQATFIKGEAGSGKSSVAVKTVQAWSGGQILSGVDLCLFFSVGSDLKIPLQKLIWGGFNGLQGWNDDDFKEAFAHIEDLALQNKVAVVIDGLDEFGLMTQQEVTRAAEASSHPKSEITLNTLCAGLLTQKILAGAKILATGRSFGAVIQELTNHQAEVFMFSIMEERDRENLVKMMVTDPSFQEYLLKTVAAIALRGNHYTSQTPLMTRSIINLNISRKEHITNATSSTELYLMLMLNNMTYHSVDNESFTMIDSEDQKHLLNSMALCQDHLQQGKTDQAIRGTVFNRSQGLSFNIEISGKEIEIPMAFLQKVGLFDIKIEKGSAYLEVIHLSILECSAAAALCRKGQDLFKELAKIECLEGFMAVIMYLSSIFSSSQAICSSFLKLAGSEESNKKIQEVFLCIIARKENKRKRKQNTFIVKAQQLCDGPKILDGLELKFKNHITEVTMDLSKCLAYAMKVTGHPVSGMKLGNLNFSSMLEHTDVTHLSYITQIQNQQIRNAVFGKISFSNLEDLIAVVGNCKTWKIESYGKQYH